jgi:hypothetical protein
MVGRRSLDMEKNKALAKLINGVDDPNRESGNAANKIRLLAEGIMDDFDFDAKDFGKDQAARVALNHESIYWRLSMILDYCEIMINNSAIVEKMLCESDKEYWQTGSAR